MRKLSEVRLFLLDMDGTFYLEDKLLPGATEFLAACTQKNIPYTFLTNNSSKSGEAYIQKLAGLGVQVSPQQMFTSGDATLLYLRKNGFAKQLLLVGTPSLEEQFTAEGYQLNTAAPKAVVLGFDTGITYQKLTNLCNAVRAGLPYIATHPDFNCPVQGGYIPDIGAVIAFVQAATGRLPDVVVGKPNGLIAQMAAQRFNLPVQQLCMVGDRLYTDIALGRAGVQTALVLSGESTREDLATSEFVPDHVFKNLAEMTQALLAE
ncbi:HAD-IIA family hydrolase [Ruminococcaceae bacterium OttesenSCG-928-A16]|nr:HAD-IIA family hydrolase [Ruminococcaceae bacterium OttesenSCG-928-A16]